MRTIFSFIVVTMLLLLWSCNHNNREIESQPFNDSIKKYLDLASIDTLPFKIRDSYNQKAFSFIDLSKNDTLVRKELYNMLVFYSENELWNRFNLTYNVYLRKSLEVYDTLNIATAYRYKAFYYKRSSIQDSSFYYYLKAENLYRKLHDQENLGNILLNKSIIQYNINDFLGAQLSAKQSLSILKEFNDKKKIYVLFTVLGNISNNLKAFDEAIENYNKALTIIKENKIEDVDLQEATCLNNIGNVYKSNNNFREAIENFSIALNFKNVKRDPELFSLLLDNIAYSKFKLNDIDGVLSLFKKSLKISYKSNLTSNIICCKIHLSEFYYYINDTINAKNFANEALDLAKKTKSPLFVLGSLQQSSIVDRKNSAKYFDDYIRISDSLNLAERKSKYRFDLLELESNEITQEKDKAVKQKWVISSIIAGVLLIVLLLFVIFRQKAKQKEFQLLQDQQKANEEIYQLLINQHVREEEARQNEKKRIALELHDNVMNQLASTRFNLYAISQNTDEETIEKALSHIDKIKDIENEIRTITHNLSNDIFTGTYNFKVILEKLIDEQNKTYSTHYKLELDANIDWEVISGKLKMNLYRILQELIYNINKHAQATFSVISIVLDNKNICMAVQDNGKGFVVSESANGIGMKNIEQRLKEVQGKINVRSSIGNGASVFITIPV